MQLYTQPNSQIKERKTLSATGSLQDIFINELGLSSKNDQQIVTVIRNITSWSLLTQDCKGRHTPVNDLQMGSIYEHHISFNPTTSYYRCQHAQNLKYMLHYIDILMMYCYYKANKAPKGLCEAYSKERNMSFTNEFGHFLKLEVHQKEKHKKEMRELLTSAPRKVTALPTAIFVKTGQSTTGEHRVWGGITSQMQKRTISIMTSLSAAQRQQSSRNVQYLCPPWKEEEHFFTMAWGNCWEEDRSSGLCLCRCTPTRTGQTTVFFQIRTWS